MDYFRNTLVLSGLAPDQTMSELEDAIANSMEGGKVYDKIWFDELDGSYQNFLSSPNIMFRSLFVESLLDDSTFILQDTDVYTTFHDIKDKYFTFTANSYNLEDTMIQVGELDPKPLCDEDNVPIEEGVISGGDAVTVTYNSEFDAFVLRSSELQVNTTNTPVQVIFSDSIGNMVQVINAFEQDAWQYRRLHVQA